MSGLCYVGSSVRFTLLVTEKFGNLVFLCKDIPKNCIVYRAKALFDELSKEVTSLLARILQYTVDLEGPCSQCEYHIQPKLVCE